MKNIFQSIKVFLQRKKWWVILIILILIVLALIMLSKKKAVITETITVQRHNITEGVSATGNVKALSDLNLAFETSGQVSRVAVSTGDKVYQGEYLASLSNADLSASVEQAKAGLKVAEANLSSLKNGSTPQQIAVSESQVEKAKSDLKDAGANLINSIQNAYAKSDDAIRNSTDLMFMNPRGQNVTLQFQTDFQLQNTIVSERASIEVMLTSWGTSTQNITIGSDLVSLENTANNNLSTIQTFLQNLALAVNNLQSSTQNSQTTQNQYSSVNPSTNNITLWKSNVSAARTNISAAMNSLSSAVSQYQSLTSALNIANNQLTLTKTGATDTQIQAQEALVEQAQANVDATKAQLAKSIITSPIDGVITGVNAKTGQTMQAGVTAFSIISYGKYNIESYIPEADIAKIKVGDTATTTLDAYGSDTFFPTSVVKIDPGETVIENVPTYKITLDFASSSDNRIKSGMTANLDILTNQKDNVLAVPSRSVYSVDTNKFVKLVNPINTKNTTEVKVETGIRGIDGYVEILSGLKDSDKIVASPNI